MLWIELLDACTPMVAACRRNLTDTEIDEFHVLSQRFMRLYVDLFGGNDITNYIHMFGSGHVTYYLRKYRNLYRFSNQGWEMLNKKLKNYYFHNTNHGGCCGGHGQQIRGDHVLPLMKMCQRNVLWKLGHAGEYFLTKGRAGVEQVKGLEDILGGLEDELEAEEGEVESPVL